ncbi:relaxase/mobilization nuclease RlxS [Altererythrobacter sp. Root672]|uniref:relaxase/mobilization nuclease RlxS n=1 Tax=Altererythrobacter sp. Root672 TaxID=1736584 RepID=UPI000701898B|nr:relaxase/mobilization nuclease RlxS [Altererythrobacter sp. Root672]KRA84049.1 conjugal transfer protein TraI [Altererythrobacter sp. Root672]
MRDHPFEPTIGRMRSARSKRGRKYLHSVLAAAMRAGLSDRAGRRRFAGSRLSRGAAAGRLLGSRDLRAGLRARRAVVKTRLVRLAGKGMGAAAAHLRYIQRDGVGREGGTGELYSAREDAADGRSFLSRCESDRHQFRFIVSAEDGAEYEDLRSLIRRLMARMEDDLGTRLEWVAANHADTLHPHTHVILRGKDDRGENLVIAPEYIARGMRERACELVSLDLGPRTDREIEQRLRRDVEAERLTEIDRRILHMADDQGIVAVGEGSMFDWALQAGRLRKLAALGLAEERGGGRWQLAAGLEDALRALGERGDIVRTMQRALTAAGLDRAPGAQHVFEPVLRQDLVGRVVARGLDDEHRDRHYLVIDAVDGRAHYARIGGGDGIGTLPAGAIVRLVPRAGGVRESDRTISAIAAAHSGRYSPDLHRRHDPGATAAYIETHVRRLEALRRSLRLERDSEGIWAIPADHLARVERHEARMLEGRPVGVEVLSPVPLEGLPAHDGATWLDDVLAAGDGVQGRDAGFGREVRAALALRRAWLLQRGLASEHRGEVVLGTGTLALLRRRELLRVAAGYARETGKDYVDPGEGIRVEGLVARRLDLPSGRFAVVENSREFSLVPWRPVLGRAIGKQVSGIMREAGTSWTIRRGPEIER